MKYKLNEEKVFSDVSDGIAILINMENGVYYGLNQFTTNIYENIVDGVDTEDLLATLSKVKGYNDDIKNKYLEFLNELIIKEFGRLGVVSAYSVFIVLKAAVIVVAHRKHERNMLYHIRHAAERAVPLNLVLSAVGGIACTENEACVGMLRKNGLEHPVEM